MESGNEVVYHNNKLPKNAFQCFEDMRRKREFFDVTFKVGDCTVSAHRVVILAAMPRFRELFLNEAIQTKVVSVPEVDPCVFDSLIDYAYTSKVKITTENVKLLLSGSCRLGIKEVQKACCEFIAYDVLNLQNVLTFLDSAQSLNCSELIKICGNYVREHFSEITQTEEFLKLDSSFVKDVIGSDELVVASEENVYEAVIKWTKYCPHDRKANLLDLLKCVRMPFLNAWYLTQIVAKEELIQESTECRDLLDEVKCYHFGLGEGGNLHAFSTQLRSYHPHRRSEESTAYVLSGESTLKARHLNIKDAQWYDSRAENFKMYGDSASVVTLHDNIYFFSWKNIWVYSPLDNDIKSSSRSFEGRAVAALGNKFYVCGGSYGHSISNKVKCFDPVLDEWSEVSPMRQCRKFASATTLGECIYVLGGENNEGILSAVEKYNRGIQMWTSAPAMLTHRKKFSSTALNGKLYACGGTTTGSSECMSTAEVYEPIIKQWKYISSLKSARSEFSLINCEGKLYAVGGRNDSGQDINTVEVWNPEKDAWSDGPGIYSFFIAGAAAVNKNTQGN